MRRSPPCERRRRENSSHSACAPARSSSWGAAARHHHRPVVVRHDQVARQHEAPPQAMGTLIAAGNCTVWVWKFGVAPRSHSPRPSFLISAMSRRQPSITTPAPPAALEEGHHHLPEDAGGQLPRASTTTTSPALAWYSTWRCSWRSGATYSASS